MKDKKHVIDVIKYQNYYGSKLPYKSQSPIRWH